MLKYRPSRFRKVRSIFSHFVRRDISHLSETVSCFFGRYDYTTITFFTKYFYFIKSAREREEAMYLPRSSSKHSDHGTLPPCPKSCQNMTRTWDTSAKIYQRTAGVSARWFDAMNDKKHRYSLQKHTFCQHALWSAVRGTSSYKIKKKLF